MHNGQYGLKEWWTGKQCKSELVDKICKSEVVNKKKNVSFKWLTGKSCKSEAADGLKIKVCVIIVCEMI